MQRLFTAVAVCALLLAPATAHALAFTWDGANSSDWRYLSGTNNNWSGAFTDSKYPGSHAANDTATIADPTPSQCVLSGAVANTVHWVTVNALTPNAAMSLTLDNASSSLDIDRNGGAASLGYLKLVGGDTAGEEATFSYQLGTFAADWIDLDGGTAETMEAILDIRQNFTVGDASDSVVATGYAAMDVANPGTPKVFTAADVVVGDGAALTFLEKRSGTGELDANTMTITSGESANEHATFRHSAGTLDLHVDITVVADDNADADATFHMNGGTVAFDTANLVLDGGDKGQASNGQSLADFDSGSISNNIDALTMLGDAKVDSTLDITVTGALTVDADTYATQAAINMADSGDDFVAGSVVIGDATYATKVTFTGSGSMSTN